jgi:hypothetical protein
MYRTLAPLICNFLKEGRKGIAFRYPLGLARRRRTCPHFKCDRETIVRGRYSCPPPFFRSPVLGSGTNLCYQPETSSLREQIKAAAARPAPAIAPQPTPSRLYPGAELLTVQYRRCAGFASFDGLRQALPRFQI